jgi:hypothetical protein
MTLQTSAASMIKKIHAQIQHVYSLLDYIPYTWFKLLLVNVKHMSYCLIAFCRLHNVAETALCQSFVNVQLQTVLTVHCNIELPSFAYSQAGE